MSLRSLKTGTMTGLKKFFPSTLAPTAGYTTPAVWSNVLDATNGENLVWTYRFRRSPSNSDTFPSLPLPGSVILARYYLLLTSSCISFDLDTKKSRCTVKALSAKRRQNAITAVERMCSCLASYRRRENPSLFCSVGNHVRRCRRPRIWFGILRCGPP